MIEPRDECNALPFTECRILRCIRLWVVEMRRGIGAEPHIHQMLEEIGAPNASSHLKEFMVALSIGSTRMIEVSCVCQPNVGPDERALLNVLSLAQDLRSFEALLVLRGFVTPGGAQRALQAADDIGNALAQAGFFLPIPDDEVRQYALSAGTGAACPAHETLH